MGLLNTKQLQRTGEGPELRQQFPTVYGLLAGLLGTSPDEMAGSVLDPNTAAVKRGADMGYLPGLIVGSLPSGKAAGLAGIAGKGVRSALEMAPQAKALETARINAVKMLGLPETNTAMDRARALGFDLDAYHGTNKNFDAFDMSKIGTETVLPFDAPKGAYFAKDPQLAGRYARGEGSNVMPVLINRDGAQMENSKIFVTDKPEKIRSRFAAFDPARINESDLLGRADPYMLGLLGALSGGAYVASEKK